MSFRVGRYVYWHDRTTKVLSGKRTRGWLLELLRLRPVTPTHSYGAFSKETAMIKETSDIKNKCTSRGRRPVGFGGLISTDTPITNTLLTRLGRHKPVLLRGYQTTKMGCKCSDAHLQPRIARGWTLDLVSIGPSRIFNWDK